MALGKQGKIKKRNVLAFVFYFQKVNGIRTMTGWLSLVEGLNGVVAFTVIG